MGGENGRLLGALLRASTEAKQPPKPSHKQSCPPLAEETAAADRADVGDPCLSKKYFSPEVKNPKAAMYRKVTLVENQP